METVDTEYGVTEAMLNYGGGFVRKLAEAYRAADKDNRTRLRTAFPEYWQQYAELARMKRKT